MNKKIDDKINYLNNIKSFELDKYINNLCNANNIGKNVKDSLLLDTKMKNYIK